MPKLPVIDAKEAEKMLLKSGFSFVRSKGSHRIYEKEKTRIIIPFHSGKSLHPKIVKELLEAIK
ncbi:MAG: addiction module toxin, HicA family [Bacteroidales bacterium]|nr:addiction module toxin, HicA family [Bacteroidales bacterium]